MAATTEDVPKLTYFNIRGLAETARLLFAAAGVKYEDVRLTSITDLKASGKLPYGQVPILETHGQVISQSSAINRYIAREHGLYGANSLEAARIDMIYEGINDIRAKYYAARNAPEDKKDEEAKKFEANVLGPQLAFLEKILIHNDGGDGWFVGKKISLADIYFQNFGFSLKPLFPSLFENTPKLAALYERASNYPGIAEWIKKRPETAS